MNVVFRRLGISLAVLAFTSGGVILAQQPAPPPAPPPAQPPAGGGQAGSVRIAFVNARAILQGMPGYAKAESLWTKEASAAQTQGQRLQAVFDSTVAAYRQAAPMMSPTARTAREKQLQAQNDSLDAKLQNLKDQVDAKERELLTPMQTRLQAIIDGIRAEGNFAMVIDLGSQLSQNIVSYDKSLDITDRVLRRLLQSN